MNILFLSRWFPYPPDNGSKIRILNLIKHLASRHQVDLISFASETVSHEWQTILRSYCEQVDVTPYRPFQPYRIQALKGFFSRRPRWVVDTHSIEMEKLVQQARHTHPFDMVIASEIDMAPYVMALPDVPKVLEDIELTALYEQFARQRHPLKKIRRGLMWWKHSRYVAHLLRAFDGCTVVSEHERGRVLEISPGYCPIEIVPNGIDASQYVADFGAPQANTLVYAGSLTYSANFDAVDFFLREIFPLVRAERPDVKLAVTGKLDGAAIDRLPINDGVVLTGYLDDVHPAIARSWLSIVPLRQGGGTRLKILESLALGTPVVTTQKGVEGLNLMPGRDLLVADEPADFAASILHVLQDAKLREILSHNGRRAVITQYDWQTIGQRLNDFLETLTTQTGSIKAYKK